jgi:hypothetical protein
VQQVQQLALVLVDALDLHVEQARRVDRHAGGRLDVGRQPRLLSSLTAMKRGAKLGLVGSATQPRS